MMKSKNYFFITEIIFMMIFHFLVDFSAVYTFYHSYFSYTDSAFFYAVLGYNMIAFATQPFLGYIVDRFNKYKNIFITLSILFMILGSLITIDIFLSMVFLGLGNALFHVSGSKEILRKAKTKIPLGLYISTGVMGLGIGFTFFNIDELIYLIYVGIALMVLYNLFNLCAYRRITSEYIEPSYQKENLKSDFSLIFFILILISLFFRSGLSKGLPSNFIMQYFYLYCCLASFLGKTIGSFIPNKINISLSILITFISMIFISDYLGVIFFNFGISLLMPITLDYLRKIFYKKEALALGISSLTLLIGNLGFSLIDESQKFYIIYFAYFIHILVLILISIYEFPKIKEGLKLDKIDNEENLK